MPESTVFSSVWTQATPYWAVLDHTAAKGLSGFSAIDGADGFFVKKMDVNWTKDWAGIRASLDGHVPDTTVLRAGVVAGIELPPISEVTRALKTVAEIDHVADNLWLVHEVNEGHLGCYMQKAVDRRGKLVGYEAFARMESRDGGVIGGGAIMQAARALHSEYQVDRLLHKHAVECFVARDLDGYLFINFLTGFIQRPEVYLEGLSTAVTKNSLRPNAVVLDVPLSDYARDLPKLKSIADYCRGKGFALALDDVKTIDGMTQLISDIRPTFVKLDGKFGQGMNPTKAAAALRDIVELAHSIGANVLAEGVENQEMYDHLFAAGVDMFQGYFIGMPERHDKVAERAKA